MPYLPIRQDSELAKFKNDFRDKKLLVDTNFLIRWRHIKKKHHDDKPLENKLDKILDKFISLCSQVNCSFIRNVVIQQELMNYVMKLNFYGELEGHLNKSKIKVFELIKDRIQFEKLIKSFKKDHPILLKRALRNIDKDLAEFDEISTYESTSSWIKIKTPSWSGAERIIKTHLLNSSDAMIANFVECSKDISGLVTLDSDFQRFGVAQKSKTIIHLM